MDRWEVELMAGEVFQDGVHAVRSGISQDSGWHTSVELRGTNSVDLESQSFLYACYSEGFSLGDDCDSFKQTGIRVPASFIGSDWRETRLPDMIKSLQVNLVAG